MSVTKGFYDITNPSNFSDFAAQLGLKNLGMTIFPLNRGEGFDFFHNHREQEEVYFCLNGVADLIIRKRQPDGTMADTTISISQGEIVRVAPQTLRAIGNNSSDQALVLVAGAMPHTYPAGFSHHDVIADVLSVVGKGETGFTMPEGSLSDTDELEENAC